MVDIAAAVSKAGLYFHTARFLKPEQVFWRLARRVYKPALPANAPPPDLRNRKGQWSTGPAQPPSLLSEDRFRFLNVEHQVKDASDWNHADRDKLWLYNLHYFDDLNAQASSERGSWHKNIIDRWIEENPPGVGNGWEPYPLSRRIVNWIKWSLRGHDLKPAWRASLAMQVRCLRRNLEYHLLGNHLLENARALIFAGAYFVGPEADGWLKKGLSLLRRELDEQILSDGGHFERSPMYHNIVLEDLLDLLNLSGVYPGLVDEQQRQRWRDLAADMVHWMHAMSHPDGGISFFNDAAFGVAPEGQELTAYAERLGCPMLGTDADCFANLASSGFLRIEQGPATALIDAGSVGPGYLPGHAHAETLSFELSLGRQRLLVNSGTGEYGDGPERLRQRGTAAHNTVVVDGENSSEVWGGFRVARRASTTDLRVRESGDAVEVSCAHDGYRRLRGRPVHRRRWRFRAGGFDVSDRIEGSCETASARYHFHPAVDVTADGDRRGTVTLPDRRRIYWEASTGEVRVRPSTWHPEFGRAEPNQVIEIEFRRPTCSMRFSWEPDAHPVPQ